MTSGTSSRIRQPTSSHRTSPSGGIDETKKIADMAEAYYQTLVPHTIGSPVATVATAHVGATVPYFYGLENHARKVEW